MNTLLLTIIIDYDSNAYNYIVRSLGSPDPDTGEERLPRAHIHVFAWATEIIKNCMWVFTIKYILYNMPEEYNYELKLLLTHMKA